MRWRAEVQGSDFDLKVIEKSLRANDLCIVWDEAMARYFMEYSAFSKLDTEAEVLAEAARAITVINGIARLIFGARTPLVIGCVHEQNADETEMLYLRTQDTLTVRDWAEAEVVLQGEGRKDALPSINPAPLWLSAAYGDAAVEKALRLFGAGEHEWTDLYRMFEVIKDDIGGIEKVATLCSVKASELELFKRTANSPFAIGDRSRHGASTAMPPAKPMSHIEAQGLIQRLLYAWIDHKLRPPRASAT